MADNYLEKKMDEHRRAAAVRPSARRLSPVGERRGYVSFKIDELRIFVTDASSEIGSAIVRRLRDGGCKVAFAAAEDKAGRALAQESGARHYPASFSGSVVGDIAKSWGGIDVLVVTDRSRMAYADAKRIILVDASPEIRRSEGVSVNAIATGGLTPAEIAHLCLFLCLKESACLSGVTLGAL